MIKALLLKIFLIHTPYSFKLNKHLLTLLRTTSPVVCSVRTRPFFYSHFTLPHQGTILGLGGLVSKLGICGQVPRQIPNTGRACILPDTQHPTHAHQSAHALPETWCPMCTLQSLERWESMIWAPFSAQMDKNDDSYSLYGHIHHGEDEAREVKMRPASDL